MKQQKSITEENMHDKWYNGTKKEGKPHFAKCLHATTEVMQYIFHM